MFGHLTLPDATWFTLHHVTISGAYKRYLTLSNMFVLRCQYSKIDSCPNIFSAKTISKVQNWSPRGMWISEDWILCIRAWNICKRSFQISSSNIIIDKRSNLKVDIKNQNTKVSKNKNGSNTSNCNPSPLRKYRFVPSKLW